MNKVPHSWVEDDHWISTQLITVAGAWSTSIFHMLHQQFKLCITKENMTIVIQSSLYLSWYIYIYRLSWNAFLFKPSSSCCRSIYWNIWSEDLACSTIMMYIGLGLQLRQMRCLFFEIPVNWITNMHNIVKTHGTILRWRIKNHRSKNNVAYTLRLNLAYANSYLIF